MFANLSNDWSWSPGVLIFLLLLVTLYLLGLLGVSRRHPGAVSKYRIASFFGAIVIAGGLLLSPLSAIGRTQLFSVHMTQAVILITVCSPMIEAACPAEMLQPLLNWPVIRQVIRALTHPIVASLIFNVTFLLWHTPRIYDSAMANAALYQTMMLSIFGASLLNWWPLLGSLKELRGMSYPMQMLYAFFDGQPVDIFAFILVFSGVAIYPHYLIPPQLHLTAFSDQAVGGALLLIPGFVDLGVMTPLFFRWLRQIEERTRQADLRRQEEAALEEEEEQDEEGVLEEEQVRDM